MKTFIHSAQNLPRLISHPFEIPALPVFFGLGFLPSLLHLGWDNTPTINSLTVAGPAIAAFWLAAGLREIRVHFVILGTLLTTLIYAVNWLMLAGHTCCSTMD